MLKVKLCHKEIGNHMKSTDTSAVLVQIGYFNILLLPALSFLLTRIPLCIYSSLSSKFYFNYIVFCPLLLSTEEIFQALF